MTIDVESHYGGHILLITYHDPLEIADVIEMTARVKSEFMETTSHTIHIISDFSRVTRLPRDFLASTRPLIRGRHPMAGKNILIIRSSFLMTIAKALLTLRRSEFIVLSHSSEEAWQIAYAILEEEGVPPPSTPSEPTQAVR